ncbi:hypothetical protein [Candidatus Avelusimicrobium luingense]|uniref:hypothetical protein n=1 Tax=Candidatus Avelusimicrobium luingense TaxID=3416211 RepID=UPI003D0A0C1F
MNKRFATVFAITALLLPYTVQAKPTWVVAHTPKASANLKKQIKCTTALTQWEQSFEDVKSAANNEQMRILTNALQEAKRLCQQDKCEEGLAVLIAVKDVLKTVQMQWIDNQLEDLDLLFMGPSTVEQRAMLRNNMRLIRNYQKQGQLEKAIQLAKSSEDDFDNPPTLTPKQLRRAHYEDAMEQMDIFYELAEPAIKGDPQMRRLLEKVNTRVQYEIYNVWKDTTLDDTAQLLAYEKILNQAEAELENLLTNKKVKTSPKKKSNK